MNENIFFNVSSIDENIKLTPPQDSIAYYPISQQKMQYIFFNKKQLLLMYHLLRFSYFDREIIKNIYHSLEPNRILQSSWLQSCIGNRSYPISIYPEFKDGRKKIYYLNKKFAKWLLDTLTLPKFSEFYEMAKSTEYDFSLYSIKSNNLYGGKPRTVNIHDLKTRRLCASIAKEISQRLSGISFESLNIQYSFPTNRKVITLLPDAVIFINGVPFYIEYDRNTELHFQLLSKVIGYFTESYYKNGTVFFVFDELGKPLRNEFHRRVKTFLSKVETTFYQDTNKTYYDMLEENNVTLVANPAEFSVSQIAHHIIKTFYEEHIPKLTIDKVSGLGGLPFEILEITENHNSFFHYEVKVMDDSYEESLIPVLEVSYITAGFALQLEQIYQEYNAQYKHVALRFDRAINAQFYPLPHQNFFIPIFI